MGDENNTNPVSGITLPEDLTTLDERALSTLGEKIAARFAKLDGKDKVTAEELAEMGVLADQMATVEGALTGLATAEAEAAEQREALRQKMAPKDETVEVEPETAEAESPAEDPIAEVETTQAPVDIAPEGNVTDQTTDETEEAVEAPEAIAASNTPAGRAPARTAPRAPGFMDRGRTEVKEAADAPFAIVASSGIQGVTEGKLLDRDGLSVALHSRARMMGDQKGNGEMGALVASIARTNPKNDVSNITDDEGIRKAWSDAHNVEDVLVASGGWCAPSDTTYDFACDFEAMPEAVDLPSITSNRGGLRYPTSPLLADVLGDLTSGFTWTEADDVAAAQPGGPTKPCFTIPCPDFDEVRLEAQGICVTAGNLTDKAYPELTNRYVDLVMTAHAHRMNAITIAKMVANSQPVSPNVANLSATEAILGGLELEIAASRDKFYMAEDMMLEGVAPRWLRHLVRRDLARRAGVSFEQTTNADIAAFFSEIGARMQFVSDWQRMTTDPAVNWPTTVDILLYPAGAHTRLDGGSLDLGVVRDSTLNATNDYTAAWTEEFWQVLTRCFSLVVTIPLCPNGWTGAPHEIACPTS